MEDREKKSGFKVMDRRRFDAEGNTRPGGEVAGSLDGSQASSSEGARTPSSESARTPSSEGARTLSSEGVRTQGPDEVRGAFSGSTSAQMQSPRGDARVPEGASAERGDMRASQQESQPHESTDSEDELLEEGDVENPRDFLAFISSLGTQAAATLSGVDVRSGMTIPPDPIMARHYIEILEMLREKTKGNLTPEETGVFDQVLHQLRLAFVRAARGGSPA